MTNDSISLFELLRKVGMDKDTDFLREGVRTLSQAIIELEAAEKIGAGSPTGMSTGSASGTPGSGPFL